MRRRLLIVCAGMLLVAPAAFAPAALAKDDATQAPDRLDEYMTRYNLHPSAAKLGRGLGNTFAGWLELPYNLETRYVATDPATSMGTGLVVGLMKSVARTAVGVYEVATFWLPWPEDYAPVLPPLQYFQKDPNEEDKFL